MNSKKLFSSLLTGSMMLTMGAMPAFADTPKTSAVIDEDQKICLTLHKLIENDGNNEEADGLEAGTNGIDAETRLPVDGIIFKYYKIGDIVNISGTVAGATTGTTDAAVGVYYSIPADSPFLAKMTELNATVPKAGITYNGNDNYYKTEDIEAAIKKLVATANEEKLRLFVDENGSAMNPTDAQGATTVTNDADNNHTVKKVDNAFTQGLYLVAETDISAHDGVADENCWVDTLTGRIHDDRADTTHSSDSAGSAHAEGSEIIQPSNNESNQAWHHYNAGEYFQESTNPEAPIVQTIASPFLVSLPTTNTAVVDTHEPGTVWQYDIDVYPKNQTTQVAKRIIDPDEEATKENLRTHEDYQVGDKIQQIIWADVPSLQQNYLNWSDNDKEVAGADQLSDEDDFDVADSMNKHTVFKISDTMSNTWDLDDVTKVVLVKKPEGVYGTNVNTNGATHSAMPTKITDWSFQNAAGESYYQELTRGTDFQVVDADGNVIAKADSRTGNAEYHSFTVELLEAGLAKINAAPYASVITKNATSGKLELTPGKEVQMMVFFDSTLNKTAKIGETFENQNYPTLTWGTTTMGLDEQNKPKTKKIDGNEIYAYTYELDITKKGLDNAAKAKFIVGRTDLNDANQHASKDLSNSVSGTDANGTPLASQRHIAQTEDTVRWVKEADGVYHVYDYAQENSSNVNGDTAATDARVPNAQHGDNINDPNKTSATAASDAVGAIEVTEINGVKYYTVTPARDGKLILKGFDSNKYTFKEIQTEDESNLLKTSFDVIFTAADPARDGKLATAKVNMAGTEANLDIETPLTDANGETRINRGIASLIVNNYDAVDLRTGGRGRYIIYATAVAMAGVLGVAAFATRKKEEE